MGSDLAGFRVTALIGSGAMAWVFRGENLLNPNIVRALKVMRPDLASDEAAARRFAREAESIDRLRHPAIVAFHGVRRDHNLLVMEQELLDGEALSVVLRRGPVGVADAVAWIREAAEGVAVAHAAGIVHRDLKPANLFLTRAGRIKVLDFGLALLRSDGSLASGVRTLGTPAYIAPEVIQHGAKHAEPAADVYALGLILYEMLLGRHPFIEDGADGFASEWALLFAHVNRVLPGIRDARPEVPAEIEAVLSRALAKDPRERHADARLFGAALGEGPVAEEARPEPEEPEPTAENPGHAAEEPAPAAQEPAPDEPRPEPEAPVPAAAMQPVSWTPSPVLFVFVFGVQLAAELAVGSGAEWLYNARFLWICLPALAYVRHPWAQRLALLGVYALGALVWTSAAAFVRTAFGFQAPSRTWAGDPLLPPAVHLVAYLVSLLAITLPWARFQTTERGVLADWMSRAPPRWVVLIALAYVTAEAARWRHQGYLLRLWILDDLWILCLPFALLGGWTDARRRYYGWVCGFGVLWLVGSLSHCVVNGFAGVVVPNLLLAPALLLALRLGRRPVEG